MSTSSSEPGWRRVLRLAWIPLVVWAGSVVVAEGAFRLAGVRPAGSIQGIYEPFGDGGFRARPNAHSFQNWFSGAFDVYTDGRGFRVGGPAGGAGEPGREVDILVAGDSQAFGQGLDYEQTVVGVLAEHGARAGLTVANAAVGGHLVRNQTELIRWQILERGLRPRVLLVCLTPRAIGIPDGYAHVEVHHGGLFGRRPTRRDLARLWVANHSAVYLVLRDAARRLSGGSSAPSASLLEHYRAGAVQEERAATLAAEFRSLLADLGGHAPRLVFAYLPLSPEAPIAELAAAAGEAGRGVSVDAPAGALAAVAAAMGAPVIDVTAALEATREAGEPVTLEGDGHYGPAASRRCGELIWNALDWPGLVGAARGVGGAAGEGGEACSSRR